MAGNSGSLLLLCCLCSVGLASRTPSAIGQSDNFKLRVDVELATVEVTALDKDGNPVGNLKKEDFELYEDGKKQEIRSIDEVNAGAKLSSLGANPLADNALHRGKTVLIVFDDSSIRQQFIGASRDSSLRFIQRHMRQQDLFAVAVYGMSMSVLQNFTSDRDKVLKAIGQVGASYAGGGAIYFENLLRSLDMICHSIAPIKGQKSLLIYSQSVFSGLDSDLSSIYRSTSPLPGPLYHDSSNLGSIYRSTLNSARKSNVKFYIIDPGALSRFSPPGLSLKLLAIESGGSTIDTAIDAELDKLDQQISNYYILGFQSNNPRHDGVFRRLEVRTKLKGVALRHQLGHLDRRPVDVAASAKQEKILLTALSSPGKSAQLPVVFRPAYFYDSPRGARVLVSARIRLEKTAFKKKAGQLGTDLNIMGVAYAQNGSMAARFSETLRIRFDKEKEADFRKGNFAYRNYFRLHPGRYRLKLAVSDESDNIGTMEEFLDVPVFPERGIAGSSIVIAEQTVSLPDLLRDIQTQLLDENDPLVYTRIQIEPSVENKLSAGSVIPLVFRIYNLQGPSDQWDLAAKASLLDEKGREYSLGQIPLRTAMSSAGRGEAIVALKLSSANVPPGKYRLVIETTEITSAQTAILQTELELTK